MKYELPDGWRRIPADMYCTHVVDGTHDSPKPVEHGHPLVTSRSIKGGRIDFSGVNRISRHDFDDISKRSRVRQWDVLITMIGTVGDACLVREKSPLFAIKNVGLLGCGGNELAGAWLYYYLSSSMARRLIRERTKGTTQQYIPLCDLRKLPVIEPSSPDEKAEIVAMLGLIDERIALLEETNTTTQSMTRMLFKSWFVDFDPVKARRAGRRPLEMDAATAAAFPDDFEDSALGPIPRGWAAGTLSHIAEVIDCLHVKKPALQPAGRPYLQLDAIRDDGLLDSARFAFISEADYGKWTSRIEVREGDCVITNVGRVGAVAQVPPGCRAAIGRNMTAIRPRESWPFPSYLIELLQSSWMRAEIMRHTDVGTVLDALNVRSIPALGCVLPGPAALKAFESVCRPLRAAMESNLLRSQLLAELRDTLISRLVTGRLRLPHARERIAEALTGTWRQRPTDADSGAECRPARA